MGEDDIVDLFSISKDCLSDAFPCLNMAEVSLKHVSFTTKPRVAWNLKLLPGNWIRKLNPPPEVKSTWTRASNVLSYVES